MGEESSRGGEIKELTGGRGQEQPRIRGNHKGGKD